MEPVGIVLWAAVSVPVLDVGSWVSAERLVGLRELERIVREAHAAMAVVIAGMPDTRDKTTAIARVCGVSAGEALARRKVAAVCDRFVRAGVLLHRGVVSSEHLCSLERVLAREGAEELLDIAAVQTPEEFRATVEQFRLDGEHGGDVAKRQLAQRYLRFFDGPDGTVGFRGLLPPVEGKALHDTLAALVDAKWRREHPERAETLGGHGGDPHKQRMADALLHTFGIGSFFGPDRDTPAPSGTSGPSGPVPVVVRTGKPAVVIVFNVDRWKATLIGHGPIPVTPSLFDQTRAELFYLFENTAGEIMKFDRARRNPTPLQRLAIMARDRRCVYAGCVVWADRCQIHHFNEVHQDHGATDVDKMGPLCGRHHPHVHGEELVLERDINGSVDVFQRGSGVLVESGKRQPVFA